eukprot:GHVT01064847.1.p1 GENE.GHVT01064847.1~~GHVT01064847.1.p1  ORF type:complete len:122 (-),score=18.03 GHVT01064847.1:738-1103(-)
MSLRRSLSSSRPTVRPTLAVRAPCMWGLGRHGALPLPVQRWSLLGVVSLLLASLHKRVSPDAPHKLPQATIARLPFGPAGAGANPSPQKLLGPPMAWPPVSSAPVNAAARFFCTCERCSCR